MTYHSGAAKPNSPRANLITETVTELKKVVWLSRREVIYLTVIVVLVVAAVGLVLGLIDLGFDRLVRVVFLGR